ncbi:STAS domain-containing protein [Agaribacterium sp. ZY112]|uniref:STAS domain-containing protein n=1 Tax=Agaribacterium sp. ZY112 TaxID=3233574 RepID=UPI00352576BA
MQLTKTDAMTYTLSLDERFDFSCVENFRRSYEDVDLSSVNTLILDFSLTKYIDSSALGMLINAKGYFSESSVTIILSNCNAQIRKLFSISRFDLKFIIS